MKSFTIKTAQMGKGASLPVMGLLNYPMGQFTEWKPKIQGKVTFSILHIDGVTRIEADGEVNDGLFIAEYTYKGMTYGATMPLSKIK